MEQMGFLEKVSNLTDSQKKITVLAGDKVPLL